MGKYTNSHRIGVLYSILWDPYNVRISIGKLTIVLFLGFFFLGVYQLSDYGLNWDSPAHLIRGQAYLRFFLTGKDNYRDLPKIRSHYFQSDFHTVPKNTIPEKTAKIKRSLYQYDGVGNKYTLAYFLKHDTGHPPLNGIFASFSNYIFYQRLGILGDIESYHLFIVFTSSLLVSLVFIFTAQTYGKFSGLVAALALWVYPLFFAESHTNVKDPVEATMYALTIYCM